MNVMKKLPPYGQDYLDTLPRYGPHVAIGPRGWDFAKRDKRTIMVLPYDEDPQEYRWPRHEYGCLVHERGDYCDSRLKAVARVLLEAGNPFVVALREALFGADFPDVYFYPEVHYVAA